MLCPKVADLHNVDERLEAELPFPKFQGIICDNQVP